MKKRKVPHWDPNVMQEKTLLTADPLGSYTGMPLDEEDTPVQDADDL